MKIFKKNKIWVTLIVVSAIIAGCMTIERITHPENAQVNSEIEIGVDLKLVPENDDNTKLIFAVLAPKSWNLTENADLTFSTTGYTQGDINNESLTVVSASDTEPTTAMPWAAALQSEIGLMGNLGPVEWVVFESQTTFIITDEAEKLINAHVNINLTTGDQNLKVFMGYFFCGKNRGLHSEYYTENARSQVLTVSGGSNVPIDYTTVSLVSTVPANFGYNDIFSVVFQSEAGPVETPLKGESEIYMLGEVIYANGNDSTEVTEVSEKTLMEQIGETTYQKYVYPKDYFDIPNDAVITETRFRFTNADQTIVVTQESGDDFVVAEACADE